MDEVVEIAHQSGRLTGKAADTIEKLAADSGLTDRIHHRAEVVADRYHDQTGRRLVTDAKLAGITGAAAAAATAASLIPAVVVIGAAYEVVSESALAQRAKGAYEERLGRDLTRDKAAVQAAATAGLGKARAAGVAAVHGYREIRRRSP